MFKCLIGYVLVVVMVNIILIIICLMIGEKVFLKFMFECCWNFLVINCVFNFFNFLFGVIFVLNDYESFVG